VEYELPGIHIDPSQGSHFFQNITSLHIGYFTIQQNKSGQFIDWDWIRKQSLIMKKNFIAVYQTSSSFDIKVDGKHSLGVLTKPLQEGVKNG
jgi:hypothetical protein